MGEDTVFLDYDRGGVPRDFNGAVGDDGISVRGEFEDAVVGVDAAAHGRRDEVFVF